ncbi:MAG: MATE family efflux transporter [Oscillospiraceae bacterium]|nr:MATE family efflux transporter [Oscillospiraceae bacterium]
MRNKLTEGKILPSLLGFAAPVFLTMLLQFLYGSIDMFIVSKFADTAEVSGVATGSIIIATLTNAIVGLSTGISVLVARRTGENSPEEAGRAIGSGIIVFSVIGLFLTVILPVFAGPVASLMDAPREAFGQTVSYIRICGVGSIFIVAYNVIGGILRGLGDSKTPLVTVAIAAVINVIGDLILVAGCDMGSAGAATATVFAQVVSVVISLFAIIKKGLPVKLDKSYLRFSGDSILAQLKLGVPVCVQNLLSSFSFVIIQVLINKLGVAASAAAGIGDKVGGILLLFPAAYLQAMSTFAAQNLGANKPERAKRGLIYGIATAVGFGMVTAFISFMHGDAIGRLFSSDPEVILNTHAYIAAAYGPDCLLTAVLFCFVGYFNGCGKTVFSLFQGLFGAFAVRIPYAFFASSLKNTNIFLIGLSAPVSSVIQILLCIGAFIYFSKKKHFSSI